ncbi:hypothetical protein BG452_42075 [Streptomyces sp. CBMA123]|nr:hypothetical protein [Streptomyces sp. CBMA123]
MDVQVHEAGDDGVAGQVEVAGLGLPAARAVDAVDAVGAGGDGRDPGPFDGEAEALDDAAGQDEPGAGQRDAVRGDRDLLGECS